MEYVKSLDQNNIGPLRKVKKEMFTVIKWDEGSLASVLLECGHQFDDVVVPPRHRLMQAYHCGQCLSNSNHKV